MKDFENKIATPLKTITKIFIAFAIINGIIEVIAGITMIFNFKLVVEMNGQNYSKDMDITGIILGTAILLVATILTLSFKWTLKRKIEGITLGIVGGGFLVCVGLFPFLMLGSIANLFVDGIRGALLVIFGILSYSNFKK